MTEDLNKVRADLIKSINHAFAAPFLSEESKKNCLVKLQEALTALLEPVKTVRVKAPKTKKD